MPFIPEGRNSNSGGGGGGGKSSSSSNSQGGAQHISLADLKQQVGLTSISSSNNNNSNSNSSKSVTLRSHTNNNSSNSNSSAINIQKIIQREAAAAAANLNNNFQSSSSRSEAAAAAAAAAQRKRRLMAKMMSNGGSGGGMATITFASSNNNGSSSSNNHPHRSHGSSSGLNSSTHLSASDRHSLSRSSITLTELREGSSSSNSNNPNDPMFVSNRRARSNNFTLKETFDLLKVWASPEMQWQMKHNFRNFRVWEAISYQMGQMGHDRTAIQCKNRIQNLTSIFYRIKKSKQDYRTFNFPYYKLIGDVLDGKKAGVSLGASFSGTAHVFGIPHPNDPFLNPNNAAAANANSSSNSKDNGRNSESPNNSGFAAHLALVEEYQHLINGQPDTYGSNGLSNGTGGREGREGGGRPSSTNSSSGGGGGGGGLAQIHNVLSPEISLSEGDSPIRVDGTTTSTSSQSQSITKNLSSRKNVSLRNGPTSIKNALGGGHFLEGEDDPSLPSSILKIEHDDSMNITLEDDGGDGLDEDMMDDTMGLDDGDEFHDEIDNLPSAIAASRNKRSFSASFGQYSGNLNKSGGGGLGGFPMKRPRGISSASSSGGGHHGHGLSSSASNRLRAVASGINGSSASSANDDPIVSYLAEMVDIERQWLDMERERADNERSMMMYMMQILQALVCPTETEEDTEVEGEDRVVYDDTIDENDLLDQQTTMDENSDDQDEAALVTNHRPKKSSHHGGGGGSAGSADEDTAQLRQMLRDNAEAEDDEAGGEGEGELGEEIDDDEGLLEGDDELIEELHQVQEDEDDEDDVDDDEETPHQLLLNNKNVNNIEINNSTTSTLNHINKLSSGVTITKTTA